jgi:hypothetical protein
MLEQILWMWNTILFKKELLICSRFIPSCDQVSSWVYKTFAELQLEAFHGNLNLDKLWLREGVKYRVELCACVYRVLYRWVVHGMLGDDCLRFS